VLEAAEALEVGVGVGLQVMVGVVGVVGMLEGVGVVTEQAVGVRGLGVAGACSSSSSSSRGTLIWQV
jgi:hypothetical protein